MLVSVCAAIAVCFGIFLALHLRPLNKHEVLSLAEKRRRRAIAVYFAMSGGEMSPDMALKKAMNPDGQYQNVNYPLHETPARVAALLKHKKHEWCVVAFEKERRVEWLWMNKGDDKLSVGFKISFDEILRVSRKYQYQSVLVFHNHINPDPAHYRCNQPSPLDLETAALWEQVLIPQNITVVKYICERGRHYRYFMAAAHSFQPVTGFMREISKLNGESKTRNVLLHLERVVPWI